ncbi:proline-rich transmembrane protein 4 [Antennarius striatus]|uniref:proline-rich transmembrane protein 4 n=1 Tax=Antennarius striatus TaxID=241820 RepID=UPI0035AE538B
MILQWSLQTLAMFSTWNLYLLLSTFRLLSLQVRAIIGKDVKEVQQPDHDTPVQHFAGPSQKPSSSGLVVGSSSIGNGDANYLAQIFSWPISSFEEPDRQDLIGEYGGLQVRSETSLMYPNEKEHIIFRSSDTTEDEVTSEGNSSTKRQQILIYQQPETRTGSSLQSIQSRENQLAFPDLQNKKAHRSLSSLLHGSNQTDYSTTPLFVGSEQGPLHPTPTMATSSWDLATRPSVITQGSTQDRISPEKPGDGLIDNTDGNLQTEVMNMEEDADNSNDDDLLVSKTGGTLWLDENLVTTAIPCKASNLSWAPTYPDDFIPDEALLPSLAHSPAFFVPLYSDWNSALATWGFAWEIHIYGLGTVFTGFGLISVVCLLGLPLRCPPGIPYLTLLHFLLLTFTGIQAFNLLYDAYSHQDRLPFLYSVLLSELPSPCLISAFSLAILLLSLCSRMHLTVANFTSFPGLPKPCLLLCMSLVHFIVSLGCSGMIQFFKGLPIFILIFPQSVFVCLAIFLSCSYLIFYCLIKVNTKHIYRLNDNGESGGSPERMQPASCPFAKVEDWGRAAGAGVGASLCLLGYGGLQLYGILHFLGFGGVDGYGFQPWPWWVYQVGCRLCEIGVCLSLSLIGTHPLFCHNSSPMNNITQPRPGSWSRLSCSSPSQVVTLTSQAGVNSSVLSFHDSLCQSKQEKVVVCDVITKGQSEALPLFSIEEPLGNGLNCVPKSSQTQSTLLPLPKSSSPPHNHENYESQLSSLDSLKLDPDSTMDLQPPSPINLSQSIDQALFSETLFSHSIFALPKPFHASSSTSLSSSSQKFSKQEPRFVENALYHSSSCDNVDQHNGFTSSRPSQANVSVTSHSKLPLSPEHLDWKGSVTGSTQDLCSNPKEKAKLRAHSWVNRGQNFVHSSLPRAIPHLSYHRHYRTLSLVSPNNHGTGQLEGTKHLSASKQLEWDLAVQAEFVNVCKQIDALSVCSDTIEL